MSAGLPSVRSLLPTTKELSMSFNKIIIVGNLGRDPELRYTPQGTAVCNFSMATNEKRRDKSGELQDITTWFRVTLWGRQAENASKYLQKGSQVYIEGRLRIDEWTDRDGNTRQTLDVNASDMQFLGGGRQDDYSSGENEEYDSGGSESAKAAASGDSGGDDDIPF
ncbi:MAG: single-stranded DNA-binding protein [Aridibacter famidurans]|nr:single-stranded DNA-binding protein [Aridibacter famidurans]